MAQAVNNELVERFEQFYRDYYHEEIGDLARKFPTDQRSLYVDWGDLYRFDPDLADDYLSHPKDFREAAEEALRLYDLPVDVKLGGAHVRVRGLGEATDIREIRATDVNTLITVSGLIRKATDVRPKVQEAAFECQRCGTLTRVSQGRGDFREPHECQGCERQGPFRLNVDQSEFVDSQQIRIQESPEGLRGGETPRSIDVHIEDDLTGEVTPGDHVTVTGVLRLDQDGGDESPVFDTYMEGVAVEVDEEEFEDMEISEADKKEIIRLSDRDDIYERMTDSIAPTIYGYDQQKLAMALQLFSGVTKDLPDGSRIRGDLHMLLIGDPGTGKCQKYDTKVTLADGTEREIGALVEERLENPESVDDGVYERADIWVQSVDGSEVTQRRATKVWKREAPPEMYRIRLRSGRELEVTPSHPLFRVENRTPVPARADELEAGEFLTVPRRLRPDHSNGLEVEFERVETAHANSLTVPEEMTPSLARLLGYIVAEGHVSGDHSGGTLTITNADGAMIRDAASALDELGVRYRTQQHHSRDGVEVLYCSSSELVRFLGALEPATLETSAHQRVPDQIMRSDRGVRAAFLRAYVEGEGHVSPSEREITVASMSEALLEEARSLLLSLGIDSQIHSRRNGSHRLRISGQDFDRYLTRVGFITERKSVDARCHDGTPDDTNTDVVPSVGEDLDRIRERLALSQHECGLPRPTYQHYERGDGDPSRESLRTVLDAFERRLDELGDLRARVEEGGWEAVEAGREELKLSQAALAGGMTVSQTAVSYDERENVVPDGGEVRGAKQVVLDRIDEALGVESQVRSIRRLVDGDLGWDRIESIEVVDPDYEWVYDLEVEGTHTYVSNGVVSHNSQLLQYVQEIAPRSVYTSGKGASTAGLCVTGDTLVHTGDGFRQIGDIVRSDLPTPVDTETAAERSVGLYTYDESSGDLDLRDSSHVWRMPEKSTRRIETTYGKEIEASRNTPLLTCGDDGPAWTPIEDVEPGDCVAVPSYEEIERSTPPVSEYLTLTNEQVKIGDESIEFVRDRLRETYGDLRTAAAELDLPESFRYRSLLHRYVPIARLDRVLDAVDADRSDVRIERAMLRHGDDIRIPRTFDADLLYLLGLVFGDGDVRLSDRDGDRGTVRISNGDEALLERAAAIIEEAFDKSVEIEYQEDRVPCVRLHSATAARLFANLGMTTPKDGLALAPRLTTAEHADAFLRGLVDADGSVSVRETGGSSVQLSTVSEELGRQVQLMLATYGVHAERRERDRRRTYELEDGRTVESTSVQTHLEVYGQDIDTYAEAIGFESSEKRAALERTAGGVDRKREWVPVGGTIAAADGVSSTHYSSTVRGSHPGRGRARSILDDVDLGDAAETVETDLRYEEVAAAVDTGYERLYDLTVPESHNFLGNGIVTHNTAAAVQDDFGDGQEWSLEAGALVLADRGIAAVDELDKMESSDRSAMHEALEQQQISISKAGINATLKSRCSLLGAANPKYGRFDQYEPIGEQIDLEPALISRFDLIFTVTDEPDEEDDRRLAEHILNTNYAGELSTQQAEMTSPDVDPEEVEEATEEVDPAIDPGLLRKYIAYAKQNCHPRMTDAAQAAIQEFYTDLRAKGTDEDAPVPVTARKLEATVRLAEASAKLRLSDEVTHEDAERVIEIVRSCLKDVGVDPESGKFDADVVETGTSKTQRDRIQNIRTLIGEIQQEYDVGAPVDVLLERGEELGMDEQKIEHEIDKLKKQGELYQPDNDHVRTT